MRIKTIFGIAIVTMSCWNVSAKDYYREFIEKHDISDETKSLKSDDVNDFWESMLSENLSFQEFFSNMKKRKGAEKEAMSTIANIPRFDRKYRPEVIDELQPLCDSIFSKVGNSEAIEFCIVNDGTVNAFTTYSSDGMVIAINSGVLTAKGVTIPVLLGIAAHEYAHAYLFHILQQSYASAKRRRRNDILEGIAAGLAVAGQAAAIYSVAASGISPDVTCNESYSKILSGIEKSYHEDLVKYYFDYSREQELEADLIAYRFLEWAGYGGENYIEALKIVAANDPYVGYDENSTHPTHNERIAFLNYVRENPELGNTENDRLRQKQIKKNRSAEEREKMNGEYFDPLY